jgi:DNA-binding beta-propeller fold protein YncE
MATSPPNPPDDDAEQGVEAEPPTSEYIAAAAGGDELGEDPAAGDSEPSRLPEPPAAPDLPEPPTGRAAPVRAGFSVGDGEGDEDAAARTPDEASPSASSGDDAADPAVEPPPLRYEDFAAHEVAGDDEAADAAGEDEAAREGEADGEDGDAQPGAWRSEYESARFADDEPGDDELVLPDYNPETGEHLPPLVDDLLASDDFGPSSADIALRRAAAHRRHRRNGRIRLLLFAVIIVLVAAYAYNRLSPASKPGKPPLLPAAAVTRKGTGPGYLLKGSDPSVLPGNLLIADRENDRLLVVSPAGQIVWTYPTAGAAGEGRVYPDEAFFTPSGRAIAVTEDLHAQVDVLSIDTHSIIYGYGHFDRPGSGNANALDVPSAALRLDDGSILVSDVGDCRILVLAPDPAHHVDYALGKSRDCKHDPPSSFATPESAFPLSGGGLVVTELQDNSVDLISAADRLERSFAVTGFKHLAMTNEADGNELVAVDDTHPGAVETLTLSGKPKWLYRPTSGLGELDDPTFAVVLPNQDVLVSDEQNDRVIVIDPLTNRIVWQYGHTRVSGRGAGYLNLPIGLDLVPPRSLIDGLSGAVLPK